MKHLLLRYLMVMVCVGLCGWALLYTSQSVQEARRNLKDMEGQIAAEETRMRVLEAEWSYLNAPARLEELAAKVLGMKSSGGAAPITPDISSVIEVPPSAEPALYQPVAEGGSDAP